MTYQDLLIAEPPFVDRIDPGVFLEAFRTIDVRDWQFPQSGSASCSLTKRLFFAPDDLHLVVTSATRLIALKNTVLAHSAQIDIDWLNLPQGFIHPALVEAAALLDVDATLHFALPDLLSRARSIRAHEYDQTAFDLSMSWCMQHACPRILISDQFQCVIEYARRQLGHTWVRDIIPDKGGQPLQLCFSNGRVLPLLCPHCKESHPVDDPQTLLDRLGNLYLADLKYFLPGDRDALLNGASGALALAFAETLTPTMFKIIVFVHPNSLIGIA